MKTLLVAIFMALSMAACGGAEIGEACDTPGATDECVSDAICSNDSSGQTCRKVCVDQTACAANESCNGITGSNTKSCQPN